jgi:2-(1,2-epoxy-1,2-dihydrophenyl)acetyl-CoA isomerase
MDTETADVILVKDDDGIVTVTLNRPSARNALRQEDFVAFNQAMREIDEAGAARVVIVTGNGEGFCAGGDLRSATGVVPLSNGTPNDFLNFYRRQIRGVILTLRELSTPTIAMVNGAAYGAGFDLALACDVRVGSPKSRFCVAWLRHGAVPAGGTTWLLPPIVGQGRAAEIIMTARDVYGEEAHTIGLLNRLVPHEQLEDATYELAGAIAANSAVALQLTKINLYSGAGADPRAAMELLASHQVTCFNSADFSAREWGPSRNNSDQ